jgi:hypothetical protein
VGSIPITRSLNLSESLSLKQPAIRGEHGRFYSQSALIKFEMEFNFKESYE